MPRTPAVRNTRFTENEPMARCAHKGSACTPDEAGRCLLRTEMDALAITPWAHRAIGNFPVEKEYSLAG